jgi:hypothetical protein
MPQSLTTELDAVNEMLECISEAPIASLDTPSFDTAQDALKKLRSVSRLVQARGWHWNSETKYPLLPDTSGFIFLPPNCLRADEIWSGSWQREVALRGSRLYDKMNHTYVFSSAVSADIVFALDWEELPESARQYIMMLAAREFQTTQLGSDSQYRYTQAMVDAAFLVMLDDETESADHNMLTDSWSVGQILMGKRQY